MKHFHPLHSEKLNQQPLVGTRPVLWFHHRVHQLSVHNPWLDAPLSPIRVSHIYSCSPSVTEKHAKNLFTTSRVQGQVIPRRMSAAGATGTILYHSYSLSSFIVEYYYSPTDAHLEFRSIDQIGIGGIAFSFRLQGHYKLYTLSIPAQPFLTSNSDTLGNSQPAYPCMTPIFLSDNSAIETGATRCAFGSRRTGSPSSRTFRYTGLSFLKSTSLGILAARQGAQAV